MNEAGPRTEWRKLRISELFCRQFKGTVVFVVAVWGEMCLIRHRQTHRESAVSIHNTDSPHQHRHHLLPTLSVQHGRHDDDLGFCLQQRQQQRQQSHRRCYRATRWACSSGKKAMDFRHGATNMADFRNPRSTHARKLEASEISLGTNEPETI